MATIPSNLPSMGTKKANRIAALAFSGLALICLASLKSESPEGIVSSGDVKRSVLVNLASTDPENDESVADLGVEGSNDPAGDAAPGPEDIIPSEVVRRASKSLGGGACKWTPPEKLNATENVQSTLLASYPGSGKRLTWRLIEALTQDVTGDDWDLSEEGYHVTSVKTSYPHPEGNWTWGPSYPMQQSMLLLRNPRFAIPSYQTMRHELNYSDTWEESYVRRPNTYTERPDIQEWENWRDAHFDREMDRWGWLIEFWMNNGVRRGNGKALGWGKRNNDPNEKYTDPHCGRDIPTCAPVRVLSFEKFYDPVRGVLETEKLASGMVGLEGVQVIEPLAWPCVYVETLKKAETEPQFVNSNRDGNGPGTSEKKFTSRQLLIMRNEIQRLYTQYADPDYVGSPHNEINEAVVPDLLSILEEYYNEVTEEYDAQVASEG